MADDIPLNRAVNMDQFAGMRIITPAMSAANPRPKPEESVVQSFLGAGQQAGLDTYHAWQAAGDAFNDNGVSISEESARIQDPTAQWFQGMTQGEFTRRAQSDRYTAWRQDYAENTSLAGQGAALLGSLGPSLLSPSGLASAAAFTAAGPLALAAVPLRGVVGSLARFGVQNAAAGAAGTVVGVQSQEASYGGDASAAYTAQNLLGLTPENLLLAGVTAGVGHVLKARAEAREGPPLPQPKDVVPPETPLPPTQQQVSPDAIAPPTKVTDALFQNYSGQLAGFLKDVHEGTGDHAAFAAANGFDIAPLKLALQEHADRLASVSTTPPEVNARLAEEIKSGTPTALGKEYGLYDDAGDLKPVFARASPEEVQTQGPLKILAAERQRLLTEQPEASLFARSKEIAEFAKAGDAEGLLKHIVDNAGGSYSAIASRILSSIKDDPEIASLTLGTRRFKAEAGGTVLGETETELRKEGTRIDVSFNARTGVTPSTALHEFIHVAVDRTLYKGGEAAPGYTGFFKSVAPKLKQAADKIKDSTVRFKVQYAASDPHELLTVGLSDPRVQRVLSGIKVGKGTAFSGFTDMVRKLLGLEAKHTDALSQLIQHFDNITDREGMPTDRYTQALKDSAAPKLAGIPHADALAALDQSRILGAKSAELPAKGAPPVEAGDFLGQARELADLKPKGEGAEPLTPEAAVALSKQRSKELDALIDKAEKTGASDTMVKALIEIRDNLTRFAVAKIKEQEIRAAAADSGTALDAARTVLGTILKPPEGKTVGASAAELRSALQRQYGAMLDRAYKAMYDTRFGRARVFNQFGTDVWKAFGGEHVEDPRAIQLATELREASDSLGQRAADAGLLRSTIENRVPQTHLLARIAKAKPQWEADLKQWLDPEQHPDIPQRIRDLYKTLTEADTHGGDGLSGPQVAGFRERTIHFAKPEYAREYAMKYGLGDFGEIINSDFHSIINKVAAAETIGGTPGETLANLSREVGKQIAEERQNGKLSQKDAARANDYLEVAKRGAQYLFADPTKPTNQVGVAYTRAAAQFSNGNLAGSAALFHTFGDSILLPGQIAAREGHGLLSGYARAIKAAIQVVGDKAVRDKIREQGVFVHAYNSQMAQFIMDAAQVGGKLGGATRFGQAAQRYGQIINTFSGAFHVRSFLEGAGVLTSNTSLASRLGTEWGKLGATRSFLENNGFTGKSWEQLQSVHTLDPDTGGVDIKALPTSLANLVSAYLTRDADLKLNHGQLYDRLHNIGGGNLDAPLTPTQAVLGQMGAFIQWPQTVYRNAIRGNAAQAGWGPVVGIVGSMVASNLLYQQASAYSRTGQTYAFDSKELWTRALVASGVFGYAGESLLGPLVEKLAGVHGFEHEGGVLGSVPAASVIQKPLSHIMKATSDVFNGDYDKAKFESLRAFQTALPNLWWTKGIVNAVVEHAAESLDPAYAAQQQRNRHEMQEGVFDK